MNNVSEQQIEEKLSQLAAIEPNEEAHLRMHQRVRGTIMAFKAKPKAPYGLFAYAAASAAVLLIAAGLLCNLNPVTPEPLVVWQIPDRLLSLARLNYIVKTGGIPALEEYTDKMESAREPRPETMTRRELMKEL